MAGRIEGDTDTSGAVTGVIRRAFRATRPALFAAIIFSLFINILGLAGPLYMLQVYDRVLASRNISTLLLLTLIVAFVYAVSAVLETLRSKLLIRAGVLFDQIANPDVFRAVQKATLSQPGPRHLQSLRDIDTIREFYTGSGLMAFCDFPWVPIYIAAGFALHPVYGVLGIVGCCITSGLAAANEWLTKPFLAHASRNALAANSHSITTFRNAEVLQAMGMVEALRARWSRHHEAALGWQAAASDRGGIVVATMKFHRMMLQSLILGIGAYLVIQRQVTPGMMIAASIIIGKALAPVEIAISQWKSFSAMREAYRRVTDVLAALPPPGRRMKLPDPTGRLTLENVVVTPPGRQIPALRNVSLNLAAGTVLGIIGPSAAGKSSLARVIVGVWPVASGAVRLDGSELGHWNAEDLGRSIGYLPQDVELFPGTIAENISRFAPAQSATDIIAAARMAGVHEMIQHLPEGYDTPIGDGGQALSGGQRQRVGLARALYGTPPLIVLDEPNANLDSVGEQALMNAIGALKRSGQTIVLITHKIGLLALADFVMVMNEGQVQAAGPRDQILNAVTGGNMAALPDAARAKVHSIPAPGSAALR